MGDVGDYYRAYQGVYKVLDYGSYVSSQMYPRSVLVGHSLHSQARTHGPSSPCSCHTLEKAAFMTLGHDPYSTWTNPVSTEFGSNYRVSVAKHRHGFFSTVESVGFKVPLRASIQLHIHVQIGRNL